jgi:hypothetical protein
MTARPLRVRIVTRGPRGTTLWPKSARVDDLVRLAQILDEAEVPATVRGQGVHVGALDAARALDALAAAGAESS